MSAIGKYRDIGEWGFRSRELISGKEGEIGAVRTVGHSVIVGQTRYSYTYTQPLLFEQMLHNMKKLAEGGALTPEEKQASVAF